MEKINTIEIESAFKDLIVELEKIKDFVEENSYTNVTKLSNTYSSQEQEYLENLKDSVSILLTLFLG